jgi:transcriptional regulator with XRE-family HTH domain
MDIKHKFGNRIKELRKLKGLSQERLANEAEIDRTYLPSIEKGVGVKIKDLFHE